jgi:hypothetical protein
VKIGGESVQIEIKPFMKQLRQGFAIGPPRSTMQLKNTALPAPPAPWGLLLTLAMAVDWQRLDRRFDPAKYRKLLLCFFSVTAVV